ncbi:MAG: hypothetical protein HKN18_14690 [Silicimonas sp.]|nr:hypothetical protein [Silicimonas sp.]
MSLEKLLIFGFALALVGALTLSATGMSESRVDQKTGYKDKVQGLADLAK